MNKSSLLDDADADGRAVAVRFAADDFTSATFRGT